MLSKNGLILKVSGLVCYNTDMNISIDELDAALAKARPEQLAATIVNAPFAYRAEMVALGIGIIVFLVANKETGQINRIALSRTELAEGTVRISQKRFEEIIVPLDYKENIISQAIHTNKPQMTDDWQYLFAPALSPEQARLNQAGGGIACSYVYPLKFDGGGGALIFSLYKFADKVGKAERDFMSGYSHAVSRCLQEHIADMAVIISAKVYPRQL